MLYAVRRGSMAKSVLAYLRKCVEKCPNKRAVSYRDHFVTFKELDQRAKKYSQTILAFSPDVAEPQPIGVLCSRDIEPIAAFLGVIYSKNFYVPLDSSAPKEKIKSIIEDAGIKIMIGGDEHTTLLEETGFFGAFITPENLSTVPDAECTGELSALYGLYFRFYRQAKGRFKKP